MLKLLLFISPLLLFSCQNEKEQEYETYFTSEDSTAIVNSILDSLRIEMNNQWFMIPTKGHVTWGPPDFSPELRIQINGAGDIMIRKEVNPKSISEEVLQFYLTNLHENSMSNNDPLYMEVSKKHIESEISKLKIELNSMKSMPDTDPEIINYKQAIIKEWENKLNVFSTLSANKIREPQSAAGIEFDYQKSCKISDQVLDSILLGFYKIREIDSQIYFDDSYAKIFWMATKQSDSKAIKQLEAFKILHPVHIIDYIKCRYCSQIEVVSPPVMEMK